MRAALVSSVSASVSAPVSLLPLAVERTYPTELAAAVARGAVVVDVRTNAQRDVQGTLPGALAISAELVADRLDPSNPGRLAVAVDQDVEWILVSAEGADSHRLVTGLQQQGLRRVTHMVGGYDAIKSAHMVRAVTQAQHILADVERVTAH
ncbi:rhodanese-related sulfurtransferase [Rhodococcus sp. SMB37]|uniref:rhodanese-like domain-containing protein n=1 Tax=Rhodococcus sp. SMB37 TaxID=2512213 RepID=UPI0006D0679B|nr:rhodanese-like domain-containing protein [Rhodococcus sp. SMB37]TCN51181.1 rhodanese-related sulfurtransferase [Rhodococcus sp. SMB37]